MRAPSAPSATRAAREGRAPRIAELLQAWGGATIAYRRRLIDSPSYTLNHEEVEKALEEGIRFAEGLTPLADRSGRGAATRARSVSRQHHNDGTAYGSEYGAASLPARTILIAAGTQPNTVLAREDAGALPSRRQVFPAARRRRRHRAPVRGPRQAGTARGADELRADGRAMSFFGDLHPSLAIRD